MKITRRKLKKLIENFLFEGDETGNDEEITVVEVIDPCDAADEELGNFLSKFPNWPVDLGEVLGSCGKGIVAMEVEFKDEKTSQVYLDTKDAGLPKDFLSKIKSDMVISLDALKKLREEGTLYGAKSKDDDVIDDYVANKKKKVINKSGLVSDVPDHDVTEVMVDRGKGLGTYYYKGGKLVHFTPRGEI